MAQVRALDSDALEELRDLVDVFFDGIDSGTYTLTWQKAQSLGKAGELAYDEPKNVLMMLRNSQSARRNDLLVGITITGTHYGVAQRDHDFGIGDIFIDSFGKKYKVANANLGTGNLYWVLDLNRFNTEDF